MRKVNPETTSQKTAWAPYEDDCPIVSSATMAQTVKKIRSNRKRDFLSFRFSATSPATASASAMVHPLRTNEGIPKSRQLEISGPELSSWPQQPEGEAMATRTTQEVSKTRVTELIKREEERFRNARPRSPEMWT